MPAKNKKKILNLLKAISTAYLLKIITLKNEYKQNNEKEKSSIEGKSSFFRRKYLYWQSIESEKKNNLKMPNMMSFIVLHVVIITSFFRVI